MVGLSHSRRRPVLSRAATPRGVDVDTAIAMTSWDFIVGHYQLVLFQLCLANGMLQWDRDMSDVVETQNLNEISAILPEYPKWRSVEIIVYFPYELP